MAAAKKSDIEVGGIAQYLVHLPGRAFTTTVGSSNNSCFQQAWFPGSGAFRELVSCSNCTDYQSRRLKVERTAYGGQVRLVSKRWMFRSAMVRPRRSTPRRSMSTCSTAPSVPQPVSSAASSRTFRYAHCTTPALFPFELACMQFGDLESGGGIVVPEVLRAFMPKSRCGWARGLVPDSRLRGRVSGVYPFCQAGARGRAGQG